MGTGVGAFGAAVADAMWPWLAFVVLGVGTLFVLASGLAPLRGLGSAFRSLTRAGARDVVAIDGDRALVLPLAAASGMAGITGATLAVTAGGAGALPWMWITAFVGMGLSFAEGAIGSRRPGDDRDVLHVASVPLGKLVAPIYALAILAVAIFGGAMLQTHQAAAVLEETMWVPPPSTGIAFALIGIVFVFSDGARRVLLRLVPVVLLLFALTAATIAFADAMFVQMRIGDAFNLAFGVGPAAGGVAGGTVALAIHHGVLRATLAGEAGLGTAAIAGLRSKNAGSAGAVMMLVPPLTAGLLGTLTALVLLTETGPTSMLARDAPATTVAENPDASTEEPLDPLDKTKSRKQADVAPPPEPAAHFAAVVAGRELFPLERAISAGLRPSQQVGQTIIMPDDSGLEVGEHYAMLVRSHARGHATAKLDAERNAVIMPNWEVAKNVNEVIFRANGDIRGSQAAWDIRIPCNREVRAAPGTTTEFLKLTPKDPNLDLQSMVTRLALSSQAYVPMDDYRFIGALGRATTEELGPHVAMYEPASEDRAFNPKLHEFYRNVYRGPYADDGSPRPPHAFIAEAGYEPPIGSIVRLALQSHPRGEPFVSITRGGGLEAPAWKFLMQATTIVLRHDGDPTKDVRVPVTARYDDHRIRFTSPDPGFQDFNRVADGWSGPFLVVPDFVFEAEVRGDTRLPANLAGRRTLIPLHETIAPQGPHGETAPYDPHPGDVLALGMHGPVPAAQGAARVAARFSRQLGAFGSVSIVVCSVVLALTTLVAWSRLSMRVASAVGGRVVARMMPLVLLAAAAAGSWFSLGGIVALTDAALAVAVTINIAALLLALPKIVAAGRELGKS